MTQQRRFNFPPSSPLHLLLGDDILDTKSECVPARSVLRPGGFVGFLFTGSWCPPCAPFVRKFVRAYKSCRAAGHAFEVVFVSADEDDASFGKSFDVMSWHALPLHDERIDQITDRCAIKELPQLVVVDADSGDVVCADGASALEDDPTAARFPWRNHTTRAEKAEKARASHKATVAADKAAAAREQALKEKVTKKLFALQKDAVFKGRRDHADVLTMPVTPQTRRMSGHRNSLFDAGRGAGIPGAPSPPPAPSSTLPPAALDVPRPSGRRGGGPGSGPGGGSGSSGDGDSSSSSDGDSGEADDAVTPLPGATMASTERGARQHHRARAMSTAATLRPPPRDTAYKERVHGLDAAQEAELQTMFAILDRDMDGRLDFDQLITAIEAVGIKPTGRIKAELKRRVPRWVVPDPQRKAKIPKMIRGVDFRTFLRVIKSTLKSQPVVRSQLMAVLEFLDPHRTGYVTIGQLKHILAIPTAGRTELSASEIEIAFAELGLAEQPDHTKIVFERYVDTVSGGYVRMINADQIGKLKFSKNLRGRVASERDA